MGEHMQRGKERSAAAAAAAIAPEPRQMEIDHDEPQRADSKIEHTERRSWKSLHSWWQITTGTVATISANVHPDAAQSNRWFQKYHRMSLDRRNYRQLVVDGGEGQQGRTVGDHQPSWNNLNGQKRTAPENGDGDDREDYG